LDTEVDTLLVAFQGATFCTEHYQRIPRGTSGYRTSAYDGWVTLWVTQKSHRAKSLIAEGFTVEVRVLSRAFCGYFTL
jgi:hypothetical protein